MKNAMNEVLCDSTVSLETGPLSGDPILLGFEDRHSTGEETPKKEKGCYGSFIEARLAIEEGVLKDSGHDLASKLIALQPSSCIRHPNKAATLHSHLICCNSKADSSPSNVPPPHQTTLQHSDDLQMLDDKVSLCEACDEPGHVRVKCPKNVIPCKNCVALGMPSTDASRPLRPLTPLERRPDTSRL